MKTKTSNPMKEFILGAIFGGVMVIGALMYRSSKPYSTLSEHGQPKIRKSLAEMNIEELDQELKKVIKSEDYEKAIEIRDLISQKKKQLQ